MKLKTKDTNKALQRHEAGLFDDLDRAFDTLMNHGLMGPGWLRPFRDLWPEWTAAQPETEVRLPRVDLIDRDTELLVKVELPGIDKEDLKVELNGDLLTIHGERRHEEKTEKENFYRAEIARGSFSRTLRLPVDVIADQVQANFDKGLLEVHLPKKEATAAQKIDVK
jgi:HSP20 family protein